jgi:hypothetical protein
MKNEERRSYRHYRVYKKSNMKPSDEKRKKDGIRKSN